MPVKFDPTDPNADPLLDPDASRRALVEQLGPDDPGATPAPTSHTEAVAIPSTNPARNPSAPPLPPQPNSGRPEASPPPAPLPPATTGPLPTTPPGPPPAGYVPPATGPFAPGATPPAPGGAGTFQPGSPNDPASQGNGKAANNYLLTLLNNGNAGPDLGALVDRLNQQFGLRSGTGLQWYPDKKVIAAAGGGYYAQGADGKWGYNVGDSQGGGGQNGTGGPVPTIGAPPVNAAWQQQMRDLLTKQLGAESTPVTADSPQVAPAISAFRDQSNRDQQASRDALVEQLYAHGEGGVGLNSGALQTGITQNAEKAATSRATFAGNAVLSTSEAQLTHLNQLLQTATQYGLTDQAQQIQAQIAAVQAQLQREGLGINLAEFMAGLNQNTTLAGLNG